MTTQQATPTPATNTATAASTPAPAGGESAFDVRSFLGMGGVDGDSAVNAAFTEAVQSAEGDAKSAEGAGEKAPDGGEASKATPEEDAEAAKAAEDKHVEKAEADEGTKEVPRVSFQTEDGKSVEVPENAKLKVKVDGKLQEVSLSDLKKDYAGKVVYERKYSELAKERDAVKKDRESFKAEVTQIDNNLNEVFELCKSNPLAGYEKLVSLAGFDSKEAFSNYMNQAIKAVNEWSKMTPEQQKLELDRRALNAAQENLKKEKGQVDAAKAEREAIKYMTKRCQEAGISNEEYLDGWEKVKGEATAGRLNLKGKTTNELADIVVNWVKLDRRFSRIEGAIRKVVPDRISDEQFFREVAGIIPEDFEVDDIAEVLQGMLSGEKEQADKPSKDTKGAHGATPSAPRKTEKTASTEEGLREVARSVLENPF